MLLNYYRSDWIEKLKESDGRSDMMSVAFGTLWHKNMSLFS